MRTALRPVCFRRYKKFFSGHDKQTQTSEVDFSIKPSERRSSMARETGVLVCFGFGPDILQIVAADFTPIRFWQVIHEEYAFWSLEIGQRIRAPGFYFFFSERFPALHGDIGDDLLAVNPVGNADRGGFSDLWILHQYVVDFQWSDIDPASDDQVLGPTRNRHETVIVLNA